MNGYDDSSIEAIRTKQINFVRLITILDVNKVKSQIYYIPEVEIETYILICNLHGKQICIKVSLMHSSACCTTTITTNWPTNNNSDNVLFTYIREYSLF